MISPRNSNPVISVIVVSWNARRYVEECLASLRQQTGFPMEVIVVDNASEDGTPELIRQNFPEAHLICNSQNYGFAKGNNIGMAASHGRYLFLVNSDVCIPAGCLQQIIEYMEVNPDVGLLGPQMLGPSGEIRRSTMRTPTLWNLFCRAVALDRLFKGHGSFLMADFGHDHTIDVEVLNGWFWVVRREALEQVGPLDEQFFMYGEDLDWCYRFRQSGWRLVFFAQASAIHYCGASSGAAPVRFYLEMQKANLQCWRKHHGRVSTLVFRAITRLHELLRLMGHTAIQAAKPSARADASYKMRRSARALWHG